LVYDLISCLACPSRLKTGSRQDYKARTSPAFLQSHTLSASKNSLEICLLMQPKYNLFLQMKKNF